jgi:pimeloyl-ACP methyl ester carboxylesterase
MATFVLVHGGFHGGWCWDALVERLEALGHDTVAPDMPIDDPAAGFEEYAGAILSAMDDKVEEGRSSGPVIIVGHSLGGHIAPLVAARRRCDHLVFLCAVPSELGQPMGLNALAVITDELRSVTYFTDGDGRIMHSPDSFFRLFYDGLPAEQALAALRQLRPEGPRTRTEAWPLLEWPDVPRTVVLAADDRILRLDVAQEVVKETTGKDAIVLTGGHSVMMSDPDGLAAVLTGLLPEA